MINISKSGNAIKFAFTDSDHYLYGSGEIECPVNSLSLIADNSNMITFRKANSNDIFLSFDPANSNLSDKAGVINFYKTEMVGSTGGSESGITSGDVETMIDAALADYYTDDEVDAAFDEVDAALSGKADTSAVTAVENDVLTLQDALAGKANTSALTAHTADTSVHVSAQEKNAWNAKAEPYSAGTGIEISGNVISATAPQGDYYEQVSGLTIEYNSDSQTPEVLLQVEDDEQRNENVFNRWGIATSAEMEDGSSYSSGLGGGTIYNNASDYPDENVTSERSLEITTDGFRQTTFENYDDGESGYTRYSSENEFNYSNGLTLSQQWYDPENDETTTSTIEINNNQGGGDGVFINLNDGSKALDLNTTNFDWTDGSDSRQINWGDIASLNDIPEYSAGTGIEISGNVISTTGGGGATYSAGTNISIDTANTINCTIPAYFNSDARKGDIAIGTNINNTNSDYYKLVIGRQIDTNGNANSQYSIGIGVGTNNSSQYSQLKGNNSVGIGKYFQITDNVTGSIAIGSEAKVSVNTGVSIGYKAEATGTTKMNLNNQIKVDTNNQIYIKDKTNTTEICLQDALSGGGGSVTVDSTLDTGSTNPVENQAIAQAFDDTNAAIDVKADQSELYELLGGSNDEMNPVTPIRLLRISQSDYDTLVENYETDSDTLYIITPDEENEGGNDWEE